MRARRHLPRGWSYAIRPGEVAASLCGIGSVTWNGRSATWRRPGAIPVAWLTWTPRVGDAQPVLTI